MALRSQVSSRCRSLGAQHAVGQQAQAAQVRESGPARARTGWAGNFGVRPTTARSSPIGQPARHRSAVRRARASSRSRAAWSNRSVNHFIGTEPSMTRSKPCTVSTCSPPRLVDRVSRSGRRGPRRARPGRAGAGMRSSTRQRVLHAGREHPAIGAGHRVATLGRCQHPPVGRVGEQSAFSKKPSPRSEQRDWGDMTGDRRNPVREKLIEHRRRGLTPPITAGGPRRSARAGRPVPELGDREHPGLPGSSDRSLVRGR